MTKRTSSIVQTRISVEAEATTAALAKRLGVSKADFLRQAIEHEVQRLTQTRPARPVSLEDLQNQVTALASQVESMSIHQVKIGLVLQQISIALGVEEVK